MKSTLKARLLAATLFVSLPSAGISLPRYEKSAQVKWADEAGTVTVSPISVMRWEEAEKLLQPKFTLSATDALSAAIPTTQSLDEKLSEIFRVALRVALPTTSVTSTETTTGNTADQNFKTDLNRSRVEKRGVVDGLDEAELAGRTAATLTGLPDPGKLGDDPMLRYLAATALYQEVQLLNRYVTDAMRYRGAQAFLMRLQVSVLPGRRSLPYDVTTDITLHPEDMQVQAGLAGQTFDGDASLKVAVAEALKAKNLDLNKAATGELAAVQEDLANRLRTNSRCPANSWDRLSIVPLVVTDNLEGIAASRSTDTASQIGLALLATISNVGAGGDFAETREAIRRAQGNDRNSLLTVARLTDDTVRVRLGAAQSPRLGNTMLPRTHNISLLVVFRPCDKDLIESAGEERIVTAVSRASFTDAFSGKVLPYRSGVERLRALTAHLNRKYNNRFSYLEYAYLYQQAAQQNRETFFDFFDKKMEFTVNPKINPKAKPDGSCRKLFPNMGPFGSLFVGAFTPKEEEVNFLRTLESRKKDWVPDAGEVMSPNCIPNKLAFEVASNALWSDLQAIRPFPEYSYANIPLVLRKIVPTPPPVEQRVLLSYAATGASTTIGHGSHLAAASGLSAKLQLAPPGGGTGTVDILATETKVSADGTSVSIKFPAYESLLKPEEVGHKPARIVVNFGRAADGRNIGSQTYSSIFQPLEAPKPAAKDTPKYAVESPAAAILTNGQGTGRLSVLVRNKGTKAATNVLLTISGAEVIQVLDDGGRKVPATEFGWDIAGTGRYTVEFANLMPGQTVRFGVIDLEAAKPAGDGEEAGQPKDTPISDPLEKLIYAQAVAAAK
jgi:hypothetical protein